MIPKPRTWLRSWALWAWLVSVGTLGLASACKDVTVPPVVEPEDDSTGKKDTTKQGFYLVPGWDGTFLLQGADERSA